MDRKMISLARIFAFIGAVLLLYLANTESYGDPATILFKLFFGVGGALIISYVYVKAEHRRSAYLKEEKLNRIHEEKELHYNDNDRNVYIVERKESNIKNVIYLLAAIITIIASILSLTK